METVPFLSFPLGQNRLGRACRGHEEGDWRAQITILASAQVLSPPQTQITQCTECAGPSWASGPQLMVRWEHGPSFPTRLPPSSLRHYLLSILHAAPHPCCPPPPDSSRPCDKGQSKDPPSVLSGCLLQPPFSVFLRSVRVGLCVRRCWPTLPCPVLTRRTEL